MIASEHSCNCVDLKNVALLLGPKFLFNLFPLLFNTMSQSGNLSEKDLRVMRAFKKLELT